MFDYVYLLMYSLDNASFGSERKIMLTKFCIKQVMINLTSYVSLTPTNFKLRISEIAIPFYCSAVQV